jgi:hypothetical protein
MLIISHKFTDNLQPSLIQQPLANCSPFLWKSTTDQSIHKMKMQQELPWTERSSSRTAAKAMETTFVASEMFYCVQQKGTTINSNSYCGTSQHEWVPERNALSFTLQMWCSCMTMHVLTYSPSNTPCTKWLAFFTALKEQLTQKPLKTIFSRNTTTQHTSMLWHFLLMLVQKRNIHTNPQTRLGVLIAVLVRL